jgi:hypothetical protein
VDVNIHPNGQGASQQPPQRPCSIHLSIHTHLVFPLHSNGSSSPSTAIDSTTSHRHRLVLIVLPGMTTYWWPKKVAHRPIWIGSYIPGRQNTSGITFALKNLSKVSKTNGSNTPMSVVHSAVLYCVRCMLNVDIPLNAGCLVPLDSDVCTSTQNGHPENA